MYFKSVLFNRQPSDLVVVLFALAFPTPIVQFGFEAIPVDGNRVKDAQFGKQLEPHQLHPYTLIPSHSVFLR